MNQSAARTQPPHLLRNPDLPPKLSHAKGLSSQPESRSSSRHPQQRLQSATTSTAEALSPQATAALIRRVLCPPSASAGLSSPRSWREQLPELTTNGLVDEQLYAIVAVVIRDFVLAWYSKITPDYDFIIAVVEIIAHCTSQLESRARHVDWVEVLGHKLPSIVVKHVDTCRTARTSDHQARFVSKQQAYHALNHHPAFEPAPDPKVPRHSTEKQGRNEAAYRQLLVQGALAALLPKNDLQNPTLRILVADAVADMILGNAVSGRLCQGWVIWEAIAKICLILQARTGPPNDERSGQADEKDHEKEQEEDVIDTRSALERSGLLETSFGHDADPRRSGRGFDRANLPIILWRLLMAANYVYLAIVVLMSFGKGLYAAASLPSRSPHWANKQNEDSRPNIPSQGQSMSFLPPTGYAISTSASDSEHESQQPVETKDSSAAPISDRRQAPTPTNREQRGGDDSTRKKRPILLYAGFSMLSRLIALGDRMPWLTGLLKLSRHQLVFGPILGRAGDTDGPLDKYLYHQIANKLSPDMLPPLLRILRGAVFPDNALGPPRVVPDAEEQAELKVAATNGIVALLPRPILKIYFGDGDRARRSIDEILDLFDDAYCNKHLVFGMIELLLVQLIPELAEMSIGELLSEKARDD